MKKAISRLTELEIAQTIFNAPYQLWPEEIQLLPGGAHLDAILYWVSLSGNEVYARKLYFVIMVGLEHYGTFYAMHQAFDEHQHQARVIIPFRAAS